MWDVERMKKRVRRVLPALRRRYRGRYDIGSAVAIADDAGPVRVAVPVTPKNGDRTMIVEYRDLFQPEQIAYRFGSAIALAERHA